MVEGTTPYVVGIGVSVRRLRALGEFFENMPPNSGASFVIVQHSLPMFQPIIDEVLELWTSMAIHQATNGLALNPNAIYLIPPGQNWVVRDRHLYPSPQTQHEGDQQPHAPIDIFFNALAQDCQTQAIGVVLEETGCDGIHGLTTLHAHGGMAMVLASTTEEVHGVSQPAFLPGGIDCVSASCDLARIIYAWGRSPLSPLQTSTITLESAADGPDDLHAWQLQATMAELESTKAELLAVKEELQRKTEELQSLQERGHTVQAKYQSTRAENPQSLQELNKRYELVFEGSKAALLYWDIVQDQADISSRFAQIMGWMPKLKNISFAEFRTLIHPEDEARVVKTVTAHLEQREPYAIEYRVRHVDGHYIWLYVTGQAVWDKMGHPTCMSLSLQDVSDRKEYEIKLQDLNKRYELLFEGSQAGLAFWDIVNDRAEISPRLTLIQGYGPNDKEIASFAEFQKRIHPDDRTKVQSAVMAHFAEKTPYSIEYRLRHADGHYIWVSDTGQAMWDESDHPICMSISQRDVSDRKQAEAALKASQAEYETVFNVPGAGMWTWNIQTGKAKVSARYKQILGYAPNEELMASFTDFAEFIHPDDRATVEHSIQGHFDTQSPYNIECRLRHKDGHYIWICADGHAIWNDADEPVFMAGTLQDISQRKQAETKLRLSQERLAAVLKGTNDGFWDWNIVTSEVFFSPRWKTIRGYSQDTQSVLELWNENIHPDDYNTVMTTLQAHFRQETPFFECEYRIQKCDGEYTWILDRGCADFNEDGEPIRMSGSERDISDRKLAQEQLQQTIEQLEQATHAKDEFLANMSHELRTPLNAILGLSEAMQEDILGAVNDQQRNALATIYESGSHLLSLISDILDTAKIGAGKLALECTPTCIHDLCHSSLRLIQQQAWQKQIHLETHLPESLPIVSLDERRIRQSLLNLLSNAVKFTPEHGTVRLEAQILSPLTSHHAISTQSILRLSVTDTGIGISTTDQAKLFQPFSQVDSKFNRQHDGTGLGLHLTRQIIELHDGTINFESEVDRGSCFWIDLPCDAKTQSSGAIMGGWDEAITANMSKHSDPVVRVNREQSLVLLVEDNPFNIEAVSNYLEAKGYQLILAENGQEAIAQVQTHHPDLILMDMQMPEMDGFDAIRQLRQLPQYSAIPIIALTALAMEGDKDRCLEAGATDYMSKPVKLKQLTRKIQELISS